MEPTTSAALATSAVQSAVSGAMNALPQESAFIINIGIYKMLGIIATIIVGAWYLATRLTRVETKVEGFDTRLTGLEGRLDKIFASGSPVMLLAKGDVILQESGLKKYIDDKKSDLIIQCDNGQNMKTAYDIQESVFKFFEQYNFGEFESKLKEAAFTHGVSMEAIRRIGGIYFRDICLKDHGFTPEDLDKPKPQATK